MKIIIHEHKSGSKSSSSISSASSEEMAEMMEMMTEMQETIQSLKRKIHKQNKKIKTMVSDANAKPLNTHIRYEYLDDVCTDSVPNVFWDTYESTDDDKSLQSDKPHDLVDCGAMSNSENWIPWSKPAQENPIEKEKVEVVVEKLADPIKEKQKEKPAKKEKANDHIAPIQVKIEEVPKVVVEKTESAIAESKVEETVKTDELINEELERIEIDGKDYYVDDDNVIYEVSDPSIRVGILDENDEPIFDKTDEIVEDIIKELVKEEVVKTEEVAEAEELIEEELEEIEIDGQDYYIDGDNVIYGMNEQRDPGDRVGVLDENDEPIFDAVHP